MRKIGKHILHEFILPMIILTITFAPFTGAMFYLLFN